MNEEEDIRGGATDEQINQAYKEAKINEQKDPRTDEKFLEERAKQKELEEEEEKQKEGPDPSEGVAGTDFSFEQALLTKGRSLLGVGTSAIVRNIYTKISKIDGVQDMITKAQEQLPSISQKGVDEFKQKAANRIAEIMKKLYDSSFDPETLRNAIGKDQSGGIGGGLGGGKDDEEEEKKKKRKPTPKQIRDITGESGQQTLFKDMAESIAADQELTYETINQELSRTPESMTPNEGLTQEEMIRYAQQNVDDASVDIEDYTSQFGASTVSRRALRPALLESFKQKYNATDEQVRRYVNLNNRSVRDIERTIRYLNSEYRLSQPSGNIEDIANEMSLVFNQPITPETIDAIIRGQGGQISYQTDGMRNRGEPAKIIRTRQDLVDTYLDRLDLLNRLGAFDKGHVYAADALLRDANVSNASMYQSNLEPEIRASIQRLVSPVELEQLINGQLTKGTDYIDEIIGNRSKQAEGDPTDKIFESLYGRAYGLEEDFKNFLFPNQNIANWVPEDLKPRIGQIYTRLVEQKLENRTLGRKDLAGSHMINIIRLEAMKEALSDFVAGSAITEQERQINKSIGEVQAFLDFVTGKDMTFKGEARRGNEPK